MSGKQTVAAVINQEATPEETVYKTIFVTNKDRKEKVIRVGTYAEARASLDAAEAEAKTGKSKDYDLALGHFALLVADPRETATEAKSEAKAEARAEGKPAKSEAKAEARAEGKPAKSEAKAEAQG